MDASANQLILNCRINEHSENNNNNNKSTYGVDNKTMHRFCLEVFVVSVFVILFFCLFWMRKHQKLHKRAAQPKTYDSRGRHLSDYNNSSNNSSSSSGSEAMKQSAQLNWGPRHSSRPMKMAKKEPAEPGKNQNYFFAQRCGKLKTPSQLESYRAPRERESERVWERVSKSLSGSSLVQAPAAATEKPPADY